MASRFRPATSKARKFPSSAPGPDTSPSLRSRSSASATQSAASSGPSASLPTRFRTACSTLPTSHAITRRGNRGWIPPPDGALSKKRLSLTSASTWAASIESRPPWSKASWPTTSSAVRRKSVSFTRQLHRNASAGRIHRLPARSPVHSPSVANCRPNAHQVRETWRPTEDPSVSFV